MDPAPHHGVPDPTTQPRDIIVVGASLGELDALCRIACGFSDVVIPGMNGIELGQSIRRLHPDLPVILTSGDSHALAEEGRHGFDLLQRPYSVEALSGMLRKAPRRSRGRPGP